MSTNNLLGRFAKASNIVHELDSVQLHYVWQAAPKGVAFGAPEKHLVLDGENIKAILDQLKV